MSNGRYTEPYDRAGGLPPRGLDPDDWGDPWIGSAGAPPREPLFDFRIRTWRDWAWLLFVVAVTFGCIGHG
jgi:hypothetical protein